MSCREAGPEGGEVAAKDLGARFDRDMGIRIREGNEPVSLRSVPAGREVVVEDVRAHPAPAPRTTRSRAG